MHVPGERMYKSEEAAEYLNVPLRMIKRASGDGRLKHTKLGKYLRFAECQLEDWKNDGQDE